MSADQFENTTAVSAMVAAQQDVRSSGRYMTLSRDDFPFQPQDTTFHPAARPLYAVIPFDGVFLCTAKQWSHKQTLKQMEKLVYLNKNVERTMGIISKSISTYERPYTSDNYPMAVLSVTRVPKQNSDGIACIVIRLTHAMAGGEDNDLKTTDKNGDEIWKKGAERKIAAREAQRNPEVIIASLINRTHFREFKEMGSSSTNAKNGISKEVQNAYRHENFHKFMSIEQYKDMCIWYCSDKKLHPDEYQCCGINDQQNPLNPFNVFTLERACELMLRYGADRGYCHAMAWETNAGQDNGMRVYTTPFNGSTTFRLQLKEFGPDDLPRYLFPWEKRPEPLESDAMFIHQRTRFGYDIAQTDDEKKLALAKAKEAMQFQCMQQDTGVKNNLFTLKDRFQSELDLEMKKANGNILDEQRVMKELSKKHLMEYLQVFQRNGDVPKALRAVAAYIEDEIAANPTTGMPIKKWTSNLTWAQEQRAAMLPGLENLDKVHTSHRDFVLVSYAARHVYWRTDLHPNIYSYGDYSVGKSFIFKLIGDRMIPGTQKTYTNSTPRADFQESSDEFDMMLEINEEANPRLFCSDMKQGGGMTAGFGGGSTMDDSGQNSEAAAFRARLTSGTLSWKACAIVDGIRFRQDVTIPANTLYFVAANWRKERVPANMMSRFIALPIHAKERKNGTLLHKMIASKRQLPSDKFYKNLSKRRYRRNQALTAFIAVGMWLGPTVLQPLTTLVSDNIFLAAIDRSRTAGLTGTGDIRRFENLRNIVETICVDDAINHLLDSPLSPIAGQRFNFEKHFRLFNPLLRTETEQAVFVLELMGGYEDPIEYHLYRAINKALHTEYDDDEVKPRSEPDKEVDAASDSKEHKQKPKPKSHAERKTDASAPKSQSRITAWVNPGPGAGVGLHSAYGSSSSSSNAMHDDVRLPYIQRSDGAQISPSTPLRGQGGPVFNSPGQPQQQQQQQPQSEEPGVQQQEEFPHIPEEEAKLMTKDQIDARNYVILPWQDYEDGNRSRAVFNDWARCELLWKQIYDKVEGVKCTADEGVHFLFSRLSQKVPCAVQDGVTIPAMAFAGRYLYISRAVLSGNAQFRLRDSIVGILSKPHMRRMTYLMGQTDVLYPFLWYTKDMRKENSMVQDAKDQEPLKIFNLNFLDPIDKQVIHNMFGSETAHQFKSWADKAMQELLQSAKYETLDTDMEEYAHTLRMHELNLDVNSVRELLAPCQKISDPNTRPFLIPSERDKAIHLLAVKAVKKGEQPPLLVYPDCYYEQMADDKKNKSDASMCQSLKKRQAKLLEIREEAIQRALADWKARGVRMEENVDEPPPLEEAAPLEDGPDMDIQGDGKEAKRPRGRSVVPPTPLRRRFDGELVGEEAHPELDETSMQDDNTGRFGESKSDQPGETSFARFNSSLQNSSSSSSNAESEPTLEDYIRQRHEAMERHKRAMHQQEQQQPAAERPFGFARKLQRLADNQPGSQPDAATDMEV